MFSSMINAKYSIVLKTLMDDPIARAEIDKALSDYPMYEKDPHPEYISTRQQLNEKLLNHYKYREIGSETPGRFLDDLRMTMHEIMPYYVQMYKSHDIMQELDDPFGNVDIVETFEEETSGTASGSTSGTSNTTNEATTDLTNNGKNVKTNTPQGDILQINSKGIDSVTHADEITWDESTSNSKSNSTGESTSTADSNSESSGTTKHTLTKKGNQGVNTYAHDMKELRQTFLNIDEMIIENKKIQELFMQIY